MKFKLLNENLDNNYRVGKYRDDYSIINKRNNTQYRSNSGEIYTFPTSKEAQEFINESISLTEATSDTTGFKAFITNLGKYNEGELIGEWVQFPIDKQSFDNILTKIGIGPEYEEWFVSDYDSEIDAYGLLGEYPSYDQLNELGELSKDPDFLAILEATGNFEDAKNSYESGNYYLLPEIDNYTDLAYEYIDQMGGVETLDPTTIQQYFDYGLLGRDLLADDPNAAESWTGDENASDEEIGEAYVEEVGWDGINNIEDYFDYEQYGQELAYDFDLTSYGAVQIY